MLRELKEGGLQFCADIRVFTSGTNRLPTDQDHNYHADVRQFSRTFTNHARKAEAYRTVSRGAPSGSFSSTSPRPAWLPEGHLGVDATLSGEVIGEVTDLLFY